MGGKNENDRVDSPSVPFHLKTTASLETFLLFKMISNGTIHTVPSFHFYSYLCKTSIGIIPFPLEIQASTNTIWLVGMKGIFVHNI